MGGRAAAGSGIGHGEKYRQESGAARRGQNTKGTRCLLKNRYQPRHDFTHDRRRHTLQFSAVTGLQIEYSWLITTYHAARLDPGNCDGKSDTTGKIAAVGNRQNDRQSGDLIEWLGGDDQNRSRPALLPPRGWLERDEINVSPLHRSSRPTGGASIHC